MDPEKQPNQVIDLQDEKTFEFVFRTHYAQLASFAVGYVGDKEVAEEIVQEMFTGIWTRTSAIDIRTSLRSYLFGAVRNACLNYLKHQKVEQKYVDRQRVNELQGPVDFLELAELEEKIALGMDKLPKKCREIFELSRFEGMKYQEIADHLSLSIKTVENQMGNALRILREELKEYLPLLAFFLIDLGVKAKLVVELLQA